MNGRIVYMYVFDTLADWEPGFALAELNTGRFFKKGERPFSVRTIALNGEPVTTMGGLRIVPDMTVAEASLEDAALLLLPGGETWMEPVHAPVLLKAKEFLAAEAPVAAICGATIALAAAGIMDDVKHTSNDPGYLKSVCPSYRGEEFYISEPAVTGGNLITASGIAPLEFTREILKKLDVMTPRHPAAWYNLYKTHEARYYLELMDNSEE